MSNTDIIEALFIIRLIPLSFAGFVATRNRNFIGIAIAGLYLCVTTVNYVYKNPGLNAVFSTPLVFLTAWYIIKDNRRIRAVKVHKELIKEFIKAKE